MFRLLSFISSLILILFEINGKKFLVKTGDEDLETEYEDFEMEDEDVEIDIKNDIERYFLQISPINATKLIPNWSKISWRESCTGQFYNSRNQTFHFLS